MAIYKQVIDFLPRPSKEEEIEHYNVSKASLYAAVLPLLVSVIWVFASLVSLYFKDEVLSYDKTIQEKENLIASYNEVTNKHTELTLKVDALKDLIQKDFYPQKFFEDITTTIKSTGDAQAEVYAYGRRETGEFSISGKADSYIDLAKIMVVFTQKKEFQNVVIDSIRYDEATDNVNFEISFKYSEPELI
jgi:hypothetical protein